MVFSSLQKADVCFALDIWFDAQLVEFKSISEAAKILRQHGKFWLLNPLENVRRSRLIESELRKLPPLTHEFPILKPLPDIGCFSLLNQNQMVFSNKRWKNPPLGNFQFEEDRHNPPNRAYLKLWEALSLLGRLPQPGETVFDLGASPGGWSYVAQTLGANVTAVDKADLDPQIAKLPRITFLKQSAFALDPLTLEKPLDWLLCDVACYPDRLYDLVVKWIASKKAQQMIFTIKLQGKTNLSIINKFQALEGARVMNLFHNKHEATFFYPAPPAVTEIPS